MVYLQALLDEAHSRARAIVEQRQPRPAGSGERGDRRGGRDRRGDLQRPVPGPAPQYHARLGPDAGARGQQRAVHPVHARALPIDPAPGGRRSDRSIWPDEPTATLPPYDPTLLTHPAEAALVKQLAKLPAAVREAGARYAPFVVAEWCYETARALSGFYRDCPVLKAETRRSCARRGCTWSPPTAQALRNGLALLGIRAPERM